MSDWENRPLAALDPVVYLDCIVVNVRHNGSVINTTNLSGYGHQHQVRKNAWACGWPKM